jgi:hypothetical protein
MRHQSRSVQAMSSGPLSHAQVFGRAAGGDEPLDDGYDVIGAAVPADVGGECLAGVFVDDVAQLQPPRSAVSSNWKSMAHTWFGRSARSSGPPPGGRVRLRLQDGGRRSPSSRHSRLVRLRLMT